MHRELCDQDGNFYIVHPFEDRIERNVTGQIIRYNYRSIDNKFNKNRIYFDNNMFIPLIKNMTIKMLYLKINDTLDINKDEFKKTNYSDKIQEVIRAMNNMMNEKDSIILVLGSGYNIITETCMVLSLLKATSTIEPNISLLIKKEIKPFDRNNFIKFKQIFGSDSDITSLYMIVTKLNNVLKHLELFKFIELYKKGGNSLDKSQYKKEYTDMIELYSKKEYRKLGKTLEDSVQVKNLFIYLQNNSKLNDKGFLDWLSNGGILKKKIKDDLKKNQAEIESVCNLLYLNYNTVMLYFNTLLLNMINIITSKKDIDQDFDEYVFDWTKKISPSLLKNLTNNTIEYKLNLCFFFAQPLIAVMNSSTNNYISMRDGSNLSINVDYISKEPNTLCTSLGSYLYYYSVSNGMNLIANIDPYILPIYYSLHYNPKNIKKEYSMYSSNINKYIVKHYHNSEWEQLVDIVRNNWSFTRFPFNTNEIPVVVEYIKNVNI